METLFAEIKRLAGFGPADSELLARLGPLFEPHIPAITDLFYARLTEHEGSRAVLEAAGRPIAQLKVSLADWLRTLFAGPHDERYVAKRWQIGRAHVRIRLPERYVFSGMTIVRLELRAILDRMPLEPATIEAAGCAIDRILDLELCIICESYRADYVEQITRQNRLAAIGQLAASLNHELRNPLSVVGSSAYAMRRLLEHGGDQSSQLVRHLDKIERNVKRTSKIANDLLDFARGRAPVRNPVAVPELLAEAVQLAALPAEIDCRTDVAAGVPEVAVDRGQMIRVLLNLIDNAADAMRGAGLLVLAARCEGDQVLIEVVDRGCGIAPEKIDRIFEPLFTTKRNGTGLGLSIARNLVAGHGGSLTVVSTPGSGSTFRIRLAAARGENGGGG